MTDTLTAKARNGRIAALDAAAAKPGRHQGRNTSAPVIMFTSRYRNGGSVSRFGF